MSSTGGELAPGASVVVSVPATSANLGPGFDCFGLALDWRDRVRLEVADAHRVEVSGEGAAAVPRDGSHLIIASTLTGLADLGCSVPGLLVSAHHTIPHGRGLGSSSAAIVAGLIAARELAGVGPDPAWVLRHADRIEGHPDNVAAATYGGFTLAYGAAGDPEVVRPPVAAGLAGVVFVPERAVATKTARGLLPGSVPHADAAANSARAALLVHAIGREPGLLFEATRDWLHQEYRRSAMPDSYALLTDLRGAGHAAVISGAGPTVLVLGRPGDLDELADAPRGGFRQRRVTVGTGAGVDTADER